jgi:glutathione S-transferase
VPPSHTPPLTQPPQAQEAEFSVNFTAPDLESGPTNPLSLKRTFGSTEPIRVKLYRDHAAVSVDERTGCRGIAQPRLTRTHARTHACSHMLRLPRPHAAPLCQNKQWCPYCQKVWLQLEEKRIPYTMEKVWSDF